MSLYTYDKNYFEKIDTSDKAYWLGFLYADGCINELHNKNKKPTLNLELTLCKSDENHLNKLKNCLMSDVPIKYRKTKFNDKEYDSCRITINCTKLCRDLIRLKCIPNKTYDIKFPTFDIVPHEYMRDFIRGYFDGDGCIYINEKRIQINFTGMFDMLKGISDFLISEKILRVLPKIYKDKRSNAQQMYIYGKDSIKEILDYLYKNCNIYLDRKYQKYIEYYKDYKESNKRGVYFSKKNNAYIVTISINNKKKRIGQYKTLDEAIEARKDAEIEKMKILNAHIFSNEYVVTQN